MTKAILTLLVLLFMTPAFLPDAGAAVAESPAPVAVVAETEAQAPLADPTETLTAILNLNYAFGQSLKEDTELIESASLALLDFAEEGDFSRIIRQEYVNGFVKNMYGVEVDPTAGVDEYIPAPEGYYAIPARGITLYSHNILRLETAGDTITVLSAMEVAAHDAITYDALAESTFVVNPESEFGYNLISCNILG